MAGSIPSNATCSFLLQAGDELNGQCSDGNTVPTGDDVGDPDEQHELTDEQYRVPRVSGQSGRQSGPQIEFKILAVA